jgi:hypothetical protein
MSKEHYKEVAKWAERVALLMLGGIVVQLFIDRELDGRLILGMAMAIASYYIAFQLLRKS